MFGGEQSESDLHLSADSSAETISDQKVAYDRICELLVAAGYFRARISSLSPFDKMLGGLAWCITASAAEVDVDLFFDEEMTLGRKIHLGETIVSALVKMKCPSVLHSHQIRGLDFNSLFPVFQWLVTHVIASREERARQMRDFSELLFHKKYITNEDESLKENKEVSLSFVKDINDKNRPERKYKRADASRSLDEVAHVQCILIEYGTQPTTLVIRDEKNEKGAKGAKGSNSALESILAKRRGKDGSEGGGQGGDVTSPNAKGGAGGEQDEKAAEEEERKMKEMMSGMSQVENKSKGISGSTVGSLVGMQADEIRKAAAEYDEQLRQVGGGGQGGAGGAGGAGAEMRGAIEAHKRQVAGLQRQMNVMKVKYEQLQSTKATLGDEAQSLMAVLAKKQANTRRIQAEIDKLKALETPENADDLKLLMGLVEVNERLQAQEEAFKANCKRQLQHLQQLVQEAQNAPLPEDEMERLVRVEELYASESAKLVKLRQLLAKKTQEAHLIKRKIDEIPTRVELVQYERRFVELYEQVAAKLEETRRYYTRYNSLSDSKKFLVKEISVLNSIFENYNKAMEGTDTAKKDKFADSIDAIRKGVMDNVDKTEKKMGEEKSKRDELMDQYNKLMEKQRLYFRAVKEFQEECTKNEKMSSLIAQQQQSQQE